MNRITIDYGIDLGTTNSAIAVMEGSRPGILPDESGAITMPSAVYIDRLGTAHVGTAAKAQQTVTGDAALRFKNVMGRGDFVHRFPNQDRKWTPEELSAEVLKALRKNVQVSRGNEIVRSAVITVPAVFTTDACTATKHAAELAGIEDVHLLLEPVAAGLAYGLQDIDADETWFIYDFGGGTFDAAILRIEEGLPTVVAHSGNRSLGGGDLDKAIAEGRFMPALRSADYRLPELPDTLDEADAHDESSKFWIPLYRQLTHRAEEVKIKVCRTQESHQTPSELSLTDLDGKKIDFDLQLTPGDVIELGAPFVSQTLSLCRRALEEAGLTVSDIDRLIFVGGSTLNPWVREAVEQEFGQPGDRNINPMSVVAEGASIYAATLKPKPIGSEPEEGAVLVSISTPTAGLDDEPDVAGKLKHDSEENLEGYTIEFIDEKTQWRSGKVRVRPDGRFRTTLRAEQGCRSTFVIEVCNASGEVQTCVPPKHQYHFMPPTPEATLQQAIGIHQHDGTFDIVIKKGAGLPAIGNTLHQTVHGLSKSGETGSWNIPICVGSNIRRAERNRHIHTIAILPEEIPRDLPASTEVEIELSVDTTMTVTARIALPAYDLVFPVRVDMTSWRPEELKLRDEYDGHRAREVDLQQSARNSTDPRVTKAQEELESQQFVRRIEETFSTVMDDMRLESAEELIRAYAEAIDKLEDALSWPMLMDEADDVLAHAKKVAELLGNEEDRGLIARMGQELVRAKQQGAMDQVRSLMEELRQIDGEIVLRHPQPWIDHLEYLKNRRHLLVNQELVGALIGQGDRAIEQKDWEALKSAVRQLNNLVPDNEPIHPGPRLPDTGGPSTQGVNSRIFE